MTQSKTVSRKLVRFLAGGAALVALVGFTAWYNLFRIVEREEYTFGDQEEHFLYGSIGVEGSEGIPYWLWVVMPKVFPEHLPGPGGWASLGFSWDQGKPMPRGVAKAFIGFERTGINCATCHVTQVRFTADQGVPDFYPGGPANQFRAQDYQRFLFRSANDGRFNAAVLMNAIGEITDLSLRERLLYRFVLIPGTKRALLEQEQAFSWQDSRPRHGPGRVDPFNPMKFIAFNIPEDHSIGNADIPSIWNQRDRVGTNLHWDGLSPDFFEVAISSAIGDGARDKYLDVESLRRVESYVMDLPAPAYPLPIDEALAARGASIFASTCATCHAVDGARRGEIVPTAEVGTDPYRTNAWTMREVQAWGRLAESYQARYDAEWDLNMEKLWGYQASLLDGIWLRGPYLHNGSVPTLRALLDPPAERPVEFYRGYDLFDAEAVGFVSWGAEAERVGFLYDTRLPGNHSSGHVWGTQLDDAQKMALVEYLKTL
jgi:mono/diheme cytochrome c family protein